MQFAYRSGHNDEDDKIQDIVDRNPMHGQIASNSLFIFLGVFLLALIIAMSVPIIIGKREISSLRRRSIVDRAFENKSLEKKQSHSSSQRHWSILLNIERRFSHFHVGQMQRMRARLLQAGLRSRTAVILYLAAKLVFSLIMFAQGVALCFIRVDMSIIGSILTILTCSLIGLFLPDVFISNKIARRRQELQFGLPDGLDLLVICAEAGLSLDAAMSRVADEIESSSPALASELALTAIELNFLPDRRQALENFGFRCSLPMIRGVVNTLVQTERYGTPLSQSLRAIASEYRENRIIKAEEKATRLPAILTVPMIIFILPSLFIIIIGPAALDIFDHLVK